MALGLENKGRLVCPALGHISGRHSLDLAGRAAPQQLRVSMVDVRLEVPLVFGAEEAVRTLERRRLSTLVEHVTLEDVRVLVALAAARAVVAPIVA